MGEITPDNPAFSPPLPTEPGAMPVMLVNSILENAMASFPSATIHQRLTSPLLTDLYQLTMAACYEGEQLAQTPAAFELFVRRLPEGFGYLIAMGLEQALAFLEQLHFSPEELAYLQQTGIFHQAPPSFWTLLAEAQFTGDVWAIAEGTPIFPHEPFLRIEGPLWQCQIVETYLLNAINYQTLIATRAARLRDVAGEDRHLLEFGTRRAFSPQGALWAARAAIAGGLDATSNVLAAAWLGVPPVGTMAHALVMAMTALAGDEDEAFAAFHRYFPQAPLLVDTFDTMAAVKRLAQSMARGEVQCGGIRLDSGDLVALSREIKALVPDLNIFASGDLDEMAIAQLQHQGGQFQGYGLGTKLVTGAPINGVYKLVEIDQIPTMKKSVNKATYPGCKQIFRHIDQGKIQGDRLGLKTESPTAKEIPLLTLALALGQRCHPPETLATIQQRTRQQVLSLPPSCRTLHEPQGLPLTISAALESLTHQVRQP